MSNRQARTHKRSLPAPGEMPEEHKQILQDLYREVLHLESHFRLWEPVRHRRKRWEQKH